MGDNNTTHLAEFEVNASLPLETAVGSLVMYANAAKDPKRGERPTGDPTWDNMIERNSQPDPNWQQIEAGGIVEVTATAWRDLNDSNGRNPWVRIVGKAGLLPPFRVLKSDGMIRSQDLPLIGKPYFGEDDAYLRMEYLMGAGGNIPKYVAEIIGEAAGLEIARTDKGVKVSDEFYGYEVKFAIVRMGCPEDVEKFFEEYEKRLEAYMEVKEQEQKAAKLETTVISREEMLAEINGNRMLEDEGKLLIESMRAEAAKPGHPSSGNNGTNYQESANCRPPRRDSVRMKRFVS